jgi:hypothetical protein
LILTLRLKEAAVSGVIFFAVGFLLGVFYGGFLIGFLSAILSFIAGFGLGQVVNCLALLREWYRDQCEEKKTPTLEFDGLFVNNEPAYFLRVRKTKGEGIVESCQAFLTVEGTEVSNAPTVWSHGNVRRYDIGGHMDLRLFKVEEGRFVGEAVAVGKWITFPSANLDQGFAEHPTHYEDFINKELTVEIHAKNGHLPKSFTKKTANIIKDAKQEGVKRATPPTVSNS